MAARSRLNAWPARDQLRPKADQIRATWEGGPIVILERSLSDGRENTYHKLAERRSLHVPKSYPWRFRRAPLLFKSRPEVAQQLSGDSGVLGEVGYGRGCTGTRKLRRKVVRHAPRQVTPASPAGSDVAPKLSNSCSRSLSSTKFRSFINGNFAGRWALAARIWTTFLFPCLGAKPIFEAGSGQDLENQLRDQARNKEYRPNPSRQRPFLGEIPLDQTSGQPWPISGNNGHIVVVTGRLRITPANRKSYDKVENLPLERPRRRPNTQDEAAYFGHVGPQQQRGLDLVASHATDWGALCACPRGHGHCVGAALPRRPWEVWACPLPSRFHSQRARPARGGGGWSKTPGLPS